MMASDVFALDLGTRTGFAVGAPGRRPESGVVLLKKEGEDASVAFSNMLAFLVARFDAGRPRMVVKEALIFGPRVKGGPGGAVFRLHWGLHAIVEAVCVRYGLARERDWFNVSEATAKKHFTGRGRWGSRAGGKAAVTVRARQLGYSEDGDDNRADALAVWDWACAHLARTPPRELRLFPSGAGAP